MVRESGKTFRFDVIFRLTPAAHQMRPSREKPGALLSSFATQVPLHTTTEAQFKCLLSSRVIGGGYVHVAFIVSNVRKRLAI